jgi:transposase-like protein
MELNLTNPIFSDADKAREHLESIRWPRGAYCPHCGEAKEVKRLEGESHRPGLHKCYSCNGHFTVTVGTVFEDSKVPLNKWILAAHLMASSKKGYSAHQLHRTIKVSYKTAWFMMHRLREAMKKTGFVVPMGGGGSTVEVDETFIGRKPGRKKTRGWGHKNAVVSLVQRNGEVRSYHVPEVTGATLRPLLRRHIAQGSKLMTDESSAYTLIGREFSKHAVVHHASGEYVRGKDHTNTVEGYFSILKRGITGTFHHVSVQHLQRYVDEFDFRYNARAALGVTDSERAEMLLKAIEGKRLTYS